MPSDEYVVRWDHPGSGHGRVSFLKLKAGTVVKLHNYYTEKDKQRHVAYVSRKGLGGIFTRGFVHAAFLQPLHAFPRSEAGRSLRHNFRIDPRLFDCRWYLAAGNPVHVAIRLRSDASLPCGSFVVVGITEVAQRLRRRPMLLVAKWFSGPLSAMLLEREQDAVHAGKLNATPATARNRCAPEGITESGVAFVPVNRTKSGRFFLSKEDEVVFSSLFALVSYYQGRRLPLAGGPPLTLTTPAQLLDEPVRGPMPQCSVKVGTFYVPYTKTSLVQREPPQGATYKTNFEIDKNSQSLNGKTYCGTVFDMEGGELAAVKLLNKNWFRPEAFAADLALLTLKGRWAHATLKEAQRKYYLNHGMEYITQILLFSEPKHTSAPFVAYELVPNVSLACALASNRSFSERAIFEILYQVAAAMTHLELNSLCHRGLCAHNVMLNADDELSASIKVTDYMLPYHHLDGKTVTKSASGSGTPKQVRWQWMSPESLFHGIFDIVGDSWSYGCLIFELVNKGAQPYAHENPAIKDPDSLKSFLVEGKTMTLQPKLTVSNRLQTLFRSCLLERSKRPSFQRIVHSLHSVLFDHVSVVAASS